MKISFPILLAVLVLSTNAHGGTTYFGAGVNSCGSWTEEWARDSQRLELWKAWVLGFVSGANIYAEHGDFLRGPVDAPAIYAWINNYCRAHPLESLRDAAIELVGELLRRAGQPQGKVQP
jgi:hypothetical protein